MNYTDLKETVYQLNMDLTHAGLVTLTWGNVSAADREKGVMAIKPSGVPYQELSPEDIVIQSLDDGSVVEGSLRPSSDAPTHLVLYRGFPEIGGVVHTHSLYATSWAQACREIPCLGTTHADLFHGQVPLTREMTESEINEAYEEHTGTVIIERFERDGMNPLHFPGVLLPHHGPFTWGTSGADAVNNAIALEEAAKMAFLTVSIDPHAAATPSAQLDKHFLRKHGPKAYYGQK